MEVPEDKNVANGNVAVCIIDENSLVPGKMFGTNNSRLRRSYKTVSTKISQVWLTGVKTGKYERMVFNNEIVENANSIDMQYLIGWQGDTPAYHEKWHQVLSGL